MNEAKCTQLLEEHGIKPTANRIVVLKELVKALHPITLSELEYRILSIDKSNIFRALTLFREHHLVHVIEGGSEGCALNSVIVTTTSTTRMYTRTSTANSASRLTAWTIPRCRRCNCPKDSNRNPLT